jgi:hypothetical protein
MIVPSMVAMPSCPRAPAGKPCDVISKSLTTNVQPGPAPERILASCVSPSGSFLRSHVSTDAKSLPTRSWSSSHTYPVDAQRRYHPW